MKKLGRPIQFSTENIRTATFRPFIKQYLYFDLMFIYEKALIPTFFPSNDNEFKNPMIAIPDKFKGNFSTLITDNIPDLHINEATQCFPLKTKVNIRENQKKSGLPRDLLQTPTSNSIDNLTIIVPDKIKEDFSAFITNMTPDLGILGHSQCFPMKIIEEVNMK